MRGLSEGSFGFVIAYLVPGLVGLSVVSDFLPAVEPWLRGGDNPPTVGGFLYGTLAALASGLTISAIRWLTLDQLHHLCHRHRTNRDRSVVRWIVGTGRWQDFNRLQTVLQFNRVACH